MKKKTLSLALALAVCLGLTVPVFADRGYDFSGYDENDENWDYNYNYSANGYTDPAAENVNFSVTPIGVAKIRWVSSSYTREFTAYVFDQDCTVTRKDGLPLVNVDVQADEGCSGPINSSYWWPYERIKFAGLNANDDSGCAYSFESEYASADEYDPSPFMISKKSIDSAFPYELEWATGTVVEYRPLSTQPTTPAQPEQPAGATASPTNDSLTCDGAAQNPTVYKIGGSNYFKIRDVAAMLDGTEKQFAVGYDGQLKSVTATTGQGYAKQPGDLAGAPAGGNKTAEISSDTIYVNGEKVDAEVYKIDGSNYFKLRDLGKALDFYVGWSQERGVYIETDKSYS